MRLPTFAGLTDGTRRVLARFPEVMAVAVASAVLAHVMFRNDASSTTGWSAWWAASGLGISAFFAVAVGTERLRPPGAGRFGAPRIAGSLAVLALLVAFALLWDGWSDALRFRRLVQFGIASHLLVAFAPFVGRREPNAFWQFNRILFVRCLVGVLFSGVLFAGLAIALASAKPLFGITVSERVYFDLWATIAFVFNTCFVLAGVPEDVGALEREESYPAGLKVFAQFILVPLVAVYLTILTAYLVKVLVTGQWPQGWIGWLVSSVSAAGLLSLLLVHPIRERAENRWIAVYTRWFYLALMPSVAMLFAAIGKRIGQYGFTEDRYFLLALACWIAAVALGYTMRRAADIRWIPVTLCALALATSFGPWGAYGVSRADQAARLARTLRLRGLTAGAEIARVASTLGLADRQELGSGIAYLAGTHGIAALPPLLRQAALADSARGAGKAARGRSVRGDEVARAVFRELGIGYVAPWESPDAQRRWLQMGQVESHVERLAGLDYAVSFAGTPPLAFTADGMQGRIELDERGKALIVTMPWARWTFPLDSTVREIELRGSPDWNVRPRPPIRLVAETDDAPARLVLREFTATMRGDTLSQLSVGGELYFARRSASVGK